MSRSLLLLAGYMLIGGLTPVFGKWAVAEIPWGMLAWFRFGIAGSLLAMTLRLRGRKLPVTRANLKSFLGVALLCVPLNQLSFLIGLKFANASHAGIFYAMNPVLVFWGGVLLGQSVFRLELFWASMLSFGGAALVTLSTGEGGGWSIDPKMLTGDLLLLMAIVTWSTFSLLSKPLIAKHGALATLASVFLLGTLMQTPFAVWDFVHHIGAMSITSRGVLGFGYLTLITSYVNYMLWYVVIDRHELTKTSVLVNANFLITIFFGWLFQGDQVNALFVVGGACTLLGIVLVIRDRLISRNRSVNRDRNVERA
ncbi:MAG TPA: DMT family transporter [Phycisphaerae bacterium]|nr:DMT family transporter [Phycisphaerae bacterium]